MNCKDARKYLYAFADGELGTRENLEVLEHIKMCLPCCRAATAQQQLRSAVGRMDARVTAPAAMRDHIESAVAGETRRMILRRAWLPLAAAAVIALSVAGAWTQWLSPPAGGGAPPQTFALKNVTFTDESPAAVAFAERVFAEHMQCSQDHRGHHNPELPTDGVMAARAIGRKLKLPILRCEQLEGVVNANFESANYCGLADENGTMHEGGHLVYRCGDDRAVSLISVSRMPEMAHLKKMTFERKDYAILHPAASDSVTIVAYNCPAATHIVCAPLGPTETLQLAEPIRYARAARAAHLALASAAITH